MPTGSAMRILGIETSGNIGGFAVVDDGRLLAEVASDITGRHVERGDAMIEYVLQCAGTTIDDLAAVAVSLGPGSFTGLRVGLALAKGLCFGRGLPLVGVPTLDVMAEACAGAEGLVVPVRDARRGEIYFGLYDAAGGALRRLSDYRAVAPEALVGELLAPGRTAAESARPLVLVGDALAKYGETLRSRLGKRMVAVPELLWPPRPAMVGALGGKLLAGGKVADLDSIEPIYVRASEAERSALGGAGRGEGRDKKDT
jgi:tRNA threonylcarbamoyladenosine biosynthesis protein TsaB